MKISFCVPCMDRLNDLERAMPHMIAAANASPPVEIALLDYNTHDALFAFARRQHGLAAGNELSYSRYAGREHYHLAHAWNLAVLASSGEYVAVMGADAMPSPQYVVEARKLIADGCIWIRGPHYKGIVIMQRSEFIDAGGYDERFEFYGGEDKELEARLRRRGGKFGLLPDGLVRTLRTGEADKTANFRLKLSKSEMMALGKAIRDENNARGLLVANEGQAWGQWSRRP